MKNISTENKSIILSVIFTIIIFSIFFCASIFFEKKYFINKTETQMGKGNYLKVNLNQNNNDNLDKQKTKQTIQENKKTQEDKKENLKTNNDYNKTSKTITTESKIQNNFYQENKKQIFDEKQYPQNEKSSSENNFEESNSGIGNFQFYSVGNAKNITEDIIDKKITQNLFYPEKAKRRGIEGEIKIKIEISKDGELISYQIISKKNNLILEEASIQTLQKIFPIEELKTKNAEENFSTIITLLYKLN